MPQRNLKKVLFDTSFLLNSSTDIDTIIKLLRRDLLECFISPTVQSELDTLCYSGRITRQQYTMATARCKKARVSNLLTRNYLQDRITHECTVSMNHEHGASVEDVRNDCSILSSALHHNMDLILSEDFHFTSKYTDRVVDSVCDKTCDTFHRLCECDILLMNKDTFLAAYRDGQIDLGVVDSMKQDIRKDSKVLSSGT